MLLCSSLIYDQLLQISLAEGRVDRLYWRPALDNVGQREGGLMLGCTAWLAARSVREAEIFARGMARCGVMRFPATPRPGRAGPGQSYAGGPGQGGAAARTQVGSHRR
jgi:hypothetical protein